MHLHGALFRVLSVPGQCSEYVVDQGWKDTVMLMSEERIRLLVRFGEHADLFLYHCHNLEQSDAGMVRNDDISKNAKST